MQLNPWFSQHLPAPRARGIAATIAVALVHIGIGWMLLSAHQSAWRPHRPRPFQVVIVSPPARAHQRAAPEHATPRAPRSREHKPPAAITYPPIPESVFDDWAAQNALRNAPDCSAENFAQLPSEQRQRCTRMFGAIVPRNEIDFFDPNLRTRFAEERRRNGRMMKGPMHTCPPTSRRALMGLGCWKGLDN